MKYWYYVSYGNNNSEGKYRSWADAAHYIKYCLDNGVTINGVRKEKR